MELSINLDNKAGFMSLLTGDVISRFLSHGEDNPISVESWTVKIEPSIAGTIPKVAIQKEGQESFFVHLWENQKILLNDMNETFFDFKEKDESLIVKKVTGK